VHSARLTMTCTRHSIFTTTLALSLPRQAIRHQQEMDVPLIGLLWMSNIPGKVTIRYVLTILLLSNTILTELQVPEFLKKPQGYELLSGGSAVIDVAPLGLDDHVIKSGHMSDTTFGRVSHIKHDCDLHGNSSLTSEYVVVGHKGRPFAFEGDSGAFVVNGHGKLVGLLIAGEEKLGTSYVTPIMEVMRDIQEVTGLEVTLP
jgi:hypothetical protein